MELKPEQLASQLESGPLKPAYLIAGPEPLRVLEAADAGQEGLSLDGLKKQQRLARLKAKAGTTA